MYVFERRDPHRVEWLKASCATGQRLPAFHREGRRLNTLHPRYWRNISLLASLLPTRLPTRLVSISNIPMSGKQAESDRVPLPHYNVAPCSDILFREPTQKVREAATIRDSMIHSDKASLLFLLIVIAPAISSRMRVSSGSGVLSSFTASGIAAKVHRRRRRHSTLGSHRQRP